MRREIKLMMDAIKSGKTLIPVTNQNKEIICINCKRRKAREGSVVCSRCSIHEAEDKFRDKLVTPKLYSRQEILDEFSLSRGLLYHHELPRPSIKLNKEVFYTQEQYNVIKEYVTNKHSKRRRRKQENVNVQTVSGDEPRTS